MITSRPIRQELIDNPVNSFSIGSITLGDFNPPTIAFLALFTYWYVFPQHFFPVLFQLRIPTIGVGICILAGIFQFRFIRYSCVKTEFIALLILGLFFLLSKLYAKNIFTASFYTKEHFQAIFVGMAFFINFSTTKKIHLFVVILITYATFLGLIVFKEGGITWTRDFLKNENQISSFMSRVLPVTIFYFFYIKKLYQKFYYYICATVRAALAVQSFSRG